MNNEDEMIKKVKKINDWFLGGFYFTIGACLALLLCGGICYGIIYLISQYVN